MWIETPRSLINLDNAQDIFVTDAPDTFPVGAKEICVSFTAEMSTLCILANEAQGIEVIRQISILLRGSIKSVLLSDILEILDYKEAERVKPPQESDNPLHRVSDVIKTEECHVC